MTCGAVGRSLARQSRHHHRCHRLSVVYLQLCGWSVETRTPVSTLKPLSRPLKCLASPRSVVCGGSGALCRRRRRAEQSANHSHASLDTDTTVWRQQCSVLTAATSRAVGRSLARQSRQSTPPSPPLGRLPSPLSVICGGNAALCRHRRRVQHSADHLHASLNTDPAVTAF